MNPRSGRPKAIVIGAGFTGLVAAYFLDRRGYAVEVHERSDRVGGLLGTTKSERGIAESGANAFLNSVRVEELFADLRIQALPAKPTSRARFVFRGGRSRRWPIGLGATFRLAAFAFRYLFLRDSVAPRAGESLAEWGRRTLGGEATEYFLLPAFQGIYAGDGARLSASLLLKPLFSRVRRPRPRIRGSVAPERGMKEVVDKLRARLVERGVRFHFGQVRWFPKPPETLTYFCGSAADAASAVRDFDPELADSLAKIEMLPLVSVTAFYYFDPAARPGFGVLFPAAERFGSLGVLYNHDIFVGRAFQDYYRSETWILGGALRPEALDLSDEALLAGIARDRARLGKWMNTDALDPSIHRWPKAIPHYTVDLESLLPEISRLAGRWDQLRLAGNYLGGIGLAKILDQVAEAVAAEAEPNG